MSRLKLFVIFKTLLIYKKLNLIYHIYRACQCSPHNRAFYLNEYPTRTQAAKNLSSDRLVGVNIQTSHSLRHKQYMLGKGKVFSPIIESIDITHMWSDKIKSIIPLKASFALGRSANFTSRSSQTNVEPTHWSIRLFISMLETVTPCRILRISILLELV